MNQHDPFDRSPEGGQPFYGTQNVYDSPQTPTPDPTKYKLSVAAMVLGIFSLAGNLLCCFCLTPVTALLAIIFAIVGRDSGRFHRYGLVGLICAIVCIVLMIALIAFYVMILLTMPEVWEEAMRLYMTEMSAMML